MSINCVIFNYFQIHNVTAKRGICFLGVVVSNAVNVNPAVLPELIFR